MSSEKQVPIQTQPQATAQMSVAGGDRNAKGLPVDADGRRDWSFGLFGCDMEKCCLACCCPCFLHSQTRRRLKHLNENGVPDPNRTKLISGDSVVYALIEAACDLGWLLQIATRKNIRARYNIRGDDTSDCLIPFCCTPCDLVQGSREVELEELSFDPKTA